MQICRKSFARGDYAYIKLLLTSTATIWLDFHNPFFVQMTFKKRNLSVCRGHDFANLLYKRQIFCYNTCINVLLKKTRVLIVVRLTSWGYPIRRTYISGSSFRTLVKIVWRDLYMVALNNWKNKCVWKKFLKKIRSI